MLVTWFSPESRTAKFGSWLVVTLAWVLACASLVCLVLLANSTVDDIAGVEPYVVYTLSELGAGLPLYKDPQQAPFSVTQYAPLYYLLVHYLARACQCTTALELTILGRSVSLAFLLAQVGVCYGLSVSWLRVPRGAAALVVLGLVLATAPWQVCARPDSMLSFFSLLTVACAARTHASTSHRTWLTAATTCACVSIFVKQSGVVNLGCVVALTLIARRWRDLIFVGGVAVGCLALGVGCCFQVWGGAFFSNAVTGVRNGIRLDPALLETFTTLSGLYLPLVTTGVWLSSSALLRKEWDSKLKVVAVFALVTLGMSSLLALKRGSAINYFNDYFAYALLLTGAVASARLDVVPGNVRPVLAGAACLWLATLFVRNLAVPVGYAHAARGGAHDYEQIVEVATTLRTELQAEGGFVLTRHAGVAAAIAPYAVLPMPAITDQLYTDGILDRGALRTWFAGNRVSREVVETAGNTHWYGPVPSRREWCAAESHGTLVINKACDGN